MVKHLKVFENTNGDHRQNQLRLFRLHELYSVDEKHISPKYIP